MKKLFRFLKPYWFFAVISPLMMMGEVFADLLQPKLMSGIVDNGLQNGDMGYVIRTGALMLVIVLVGGFFGVFCAYTAATAAQSFGRDLRIHAYKKVMSLSIEQTDDFTTGSLVTRMTNDIAMVVEFVEMLLRMCVRAPMVFIGGVIMMLTLDLSFGVVLACALPVLVAMVVFILVKATPLFGVLQKKLDKVNSVVQENVSGARVVKAYGQEDYEIGRFGAVNNELRQTNFRVLKLMALFGPVTSLVMNIAIIAIIYIGGFQISIKNAGMSAGSIMAAITYVTQILMSIMMVSMMFQMVSRAMASAARINEVIDAEPVIEGGTRTEGEGSEAIEFRNVSFRYPGTHGEPVLKNINLTIKKGETLAIIGATGCGKTSLVNLLPRFYDTTEGTVLFDGVDVKEYELSALREKIGYVMQKSELFSDTVANNIRWGNPDAGMDEITEAAETAQAAEFIEGFSEGYDTFIAEKGASLSGGQKQRVSIARAMVRKPSVLILDDSTSALDLVTEGRLQRAIKEKLADTTIIMIAQRIASVKQADRIAVLEEGTILHCGTHEELLQCSATYRDIYDSQMKSGAYMEGGAANE
ncbi:MAG: ABC transporter ATP-binding protein [Lachnospiraceae bacterium]|nr:ABC transporter ATP-binding protein [Lachnospiraceae bacterium]